MHLLLSGGNRGVVFNVDAPVGPGCPNKFEDVLLVQFLLKNMGDLFITPEDRRERFDKVTTSGSCDKATTDGILNAQEMFRDQTWGTIVDGKISVARGLSYGSTNLHWTIVDLNLCVRAQDINRMWPCLGDFNYCPPLLNFKAKQLL